MEKLNCRQIPFGSCCQLDYYLSGEWSVISDLPDQNYKIADDDVLVVGYLEAIIAFPALDINSLLFAKYGILCLIVLDIMLSDMLLLLSDCLSYLLDLLF